MWRPANSRKIGLKGQEPPSRSLAGQPLGRVGAASWAGGAALCFGAKFVSWSTTLSLLSVGGEGTGLARTQGRRPTGLGHGAGPKGLAGPSSDTLLWDVQQYVLKFLIPHFGRFLRAGPPAPLHVHFRHRVHVDQGGRRGQGHHFVVHFSARVVRSPPIPGLLPEDEG